ncbi:enoyl-CoA hydratase [Lentibacillus sp. N15]|uniref:enoyl-CoA hydratase n=1 Tax=Lentibacillus songyuanensis TaxID=3136161 RepID=UPI0031BBA84D
MTELVQYEKVLDHIAVITLNRPESANAMSKQLLSELHAFVTEVNQDKAIRCVVITAKGEKAFCAGADLKERKGMDDAQTIEAVRMIGETVTAIENINMPVIAAINGVAFGGGLELALACDIRIASADARMGLTETSLAIIPGAGGTQRLSRLVGLGQAKRLIFTAKRIQADEANRIGLVEQVTSADTLLDEALEMAKAIANNGPIALRQAKTAINQGYQTDITTGLRIEHLCYKETILTNDRTEGLQAFKEKRKPIYRGE